MTRRSPGLRKNVETHQQLNEKQLSYEQLFHRVDKNHDGRIDVNELIHLLETTDVEASSQAHAATARVSFV